MQFDIVLNMFFNVFGGLAIFLLGMHNMSEGMQAITGNQLRKMIASVTDNRFIACFTGALVTSLIQSSSVTTVITVGFVNAGVMTLLQAIGIILGADIGTTMTGWIVSLDIAKYGLPILGLAGFFFLFTKNDRGRFFAMMFMGIGMIFFGLQLMKLGMKPLEHSPKILSWFSRFEPDSFFGVIKCVLVGAFVTIIVQSSSATVAITMSLASTGIIDFNIAVALVLGENIGTTITAFLASLGVSTNAKRVAYAHILIKVLGVALMSFVFFYYIDLLNHLLGENIGITKRIAFSHTLFNIFLVFLFLPLRDPLAAILKKIVPDKPQKEIPRLTFLDVHMLETPIMAIEQSRGEIKRMGDSVHHMFGTLREIIATNEINDTLVKNIFHQEDVLDIMQKEISSFLVHILSNEIPLAVVNETHAQIRIADEYESISDYLTTILKLYLKLHNAGIMLPERKKGELLELHEMVASYFSMVDAAFIERRPNILPKVRTEGNAITHHFREMRTIHLQRISETHMDTLLSLSFMDILNSYRKIKDHALNIAEALAGEK